jgi:hypothetical protein
MPSANRDPQGSTEATRAYSIIPSFTEASRVYSVILQRQSLDYIRHALNMYFRFPFFLSFLKFEILVNKGSPVATNCLRLSQLIPKKNVRNGKEGWNGRWHAFK